MVFNTTLYPQESKYLWQITRRATDCPESLYFEDKRLTTIGQWYFGYLPFRELSFPNAKTLQSGAFYAASSLVSLTLDWSNITTIPIQCFQNCYLLEGSINLPSCTTIGSSAFNACSKITRVEGSNVTSVYNNAFQNCKALTEVNFPAQLTFTNSSQFDGCTNLVSVAFGNAHILRQYMFRNCTHLTSLSLPKATGADVMCFNSCTALQMLYMPSGTYAYQSAFQDCSSLNTLIYMGSSSAGTISANAFLRCRSLLSLYLLGTLVKPLANINAFASTPISNYTTYTGGVNGSIYVPSSLYADYIAANNWSTYAARFVSMTDQEIEDFLTNPINITAEFNQGDNIIYSNDSLDTLKQYLTVKANGLEGSTTLTSDQYTLSGTLTGGYNIITITYNTLTTTFNALITPVGYSLLSYIKSTGAGQYIDTNYTPNSNTVIDCEVWTEWYGGGTTENYIFGSKEPQFCIQKYGSSGSMVEIDCFGGATTISCPTGQKNTINFTGSGSITINGSSKTITVGSNTPNSSLLLFTGRNTNGNLGHFGAFRFYSFKISENNIVLKNFIPCIRSLDSVVGFYDTINATFYTNAGSGTFSYA